MTSRRLKALLDEILRATACGLTVDDVEEAVAIRVSKKSLKELTQHQAEGLRLYDSHAVIGPWLRTLPPDIFLRPPADLREYGIRRVGLSDIFDEVDETERVGYLAIAHSGGRACVLLFVPHSAAQEDVTTIFGPKNAWAELVVGVWEWARACTVFRFSRENRMNRTLAVWVRINDAIKARPGGCYSLGDLELDPHTDTWQGVILGQKSSDEAEVGKVQRLAGRLTKLKDGLWVRGGVPVGTRLGRTADERGVLRPHKKMGLERDEDAVPELTQVLTQYAQGISKAVIAVGQAGLGSRDGRGVLLLDRLMPLVKASDREAAVLAMQQMLAAGQVTEPELRRVEDAAAVASTAPLRAKATSAATDYVDRILRGRRHLRTGVLDVPVFGDIAGRTNYLGWRPKFVVEGSAVDGVERVAEPDLPAEDIYWTFDERKKAKARTHGYWVMRLDLGSPVVQLTDEQWSAIEIRMEDAADAMERRTATGQRRPLGGLTWASPLGRLRMGQGGEREIYTICALDGAHLHSVPATQAARALGSLLAGLVEAVDSAPLPLLQPGTDEPRTYHERVERQIKRHNKRFEEVEGIVDGLLRDRAQKPEGSREHRQLDQQITTLNAELDDIEHRDLPRLQAKLSKKVEQAEATVEEAPADFAYLAVVAAALSRCDPLGPAALHEAVSWLLEHGKGLSNLRVGDSPRQLLIDVRVRVPLVDGTVGWLDAGTLDLIDRRLSATRKDEIIDDLARRFLRDGESLDTLKLRFKYSEGELLKHAASWLAEHTNLNMYLRAAVVTAAATGQGLPVGPVVYAHATGDPTLLGEVRARAGAWIVDQIERAYLHPQATWAKNSGWVRSPLATWRTATLSIAQDGATRWQTLVASVDGVRDHDHLKDLLHPGRRTFWQPPLVLADGWVTAHVCRAADCPGGEAPPLTGILAVPELLISADAIYCRHCWRTCTSQEVLPAPYRHLYDVNVGASKLSRADGIPFIAKAPIAPPRATTFIRTRDVAAELGLSMHRVLMLAKSGQIPAHRTPGGKFVFDAERALSPAVRSRYGTGTRPTSAEDRRLTLHRAAERLGTTPSIVRSLSRNGALMNIGGAGAALYDAGEVDGLLAHVRQHTGLSTATLRDLTNLTELAARWELTPTMIRRLVTHGVLQPVQIGPLTYISNDSLRRLDERTRLALDPKVRLSSAEVAKLAGLHNATVLHHHAQGGLPGVQLTPNGKILFLPDEVNAWLAAR